MAKRNKYVAEYSINGKHQMQYTGFKNIQACKSWIAWLCKTKTPKQGKGLWKVFIEDNTLGEPIAQGVTTNA